MSEDVVALLINPVTDGAMPIRCRIENIGNQVQIKYGGLDGWIIQIPMQSLQNVLGEDDLHG